MLTTDHHQTQAIDTRALSHAMLPESPRSLRFIDFSRKAKRGNRRSIIIAPFFFSYVHSSQSTQNPVPAFPQGIDGQRPLLPIMMPSNCGFHPKPCWHCMRDRCLLFTRAKAMMRFDLQLIAHQAWTKCYGVITCYFAFWKVDSLAKRLLFINGFPREKIQ